MALVLPSRELQKGKDTYITAGNNITTFETSLNMKTCDHKFKFNSLLYGSTMVIRKKKTSKLRALIG